LSVADDIQTYYGQILKTSADLKTNACCPTDALPEWLKRIVSMVHPEVLERFYGCGSPIPPALTGKSVLDLGCGTGRDCFVLSYLVGESGNVVGVDMTDEQLAVAIKHSDYHRRQFGHSRSNVDFRKGYIEDLRAAGIEDESMDVVVSNCVLNLSPDKQSVFSEIMRVLKPGGELYFSDVFCARRIPEALANHPVLRGECLGGAMYTEDFRRLLVKLGVNDYRCVSSSVLTVEDPELAELVHGIDFYSKTVRAFKIPLEDRCEDYGQVAWYLGGIDDSPHEFVLDDHHVFEVNRPMLVCSNTARMLSRTRFSPWFRIDGDESAHYGLFDCASPESTAEKGEGGCC